LFLIQDVQAFLCALCGSVWPSSWPLRENDLPDSGLSGLGIEDWKMKNE
jgi:hypothetical protein